MNKYNKTWITLFNKNKTKDLYREVLNKEFPHNDKCLCCDDIIYYYDSTFKNLDGVLTPTNKSYLSYKDIDGEKYYLSVCEDCLIKKYPKYEKINKSRVFNRICDITEYAFNIPIEISNKWKKNNYAITKDTIVIWEHELPDPSDLVKIIRQYDRYRI